MEDTDAIVVISTVLLLVLLRIFVKRKIRVDTPCKCASLQSAVKQQEKLSCRRETARRFVSLNILLSLKVIRNDTVAYGVCVSAY